MITGPWLEFKQESKIVTLKFKTPAHIWNICCIKFSEAVSRRSEIVNMEPEKLESLHIAHDTTLHFNVKSFIMEQSNIAIFLYDEQDWEKTKQEAHLHLGLTSPCFSISHSNPMQFSIMEEQYLYSCNICTGNELQH